MKVWHVFLPGEGIHRVFTRRTGLVKFLNRYKASNGMLPGQAIVIHGRRKTMGDLGIPFTS